MQEVSLSAGNAPHIPTTEEEDFTARSDTSMMDLASFQRAMSGDHQTALDGLTLLGRSGITQSVVTTIPSVSLPLGHKRGAYLLVHIWLTAKYVVIFQIPFRHPLIRLTGLPVEMAHRMSTFLECLFSYNIFLFFKQRCDGIKHPALWSVSSLYDRIDHPTRWSVCNAIESEVIAIPVRDFSKWKGLIHGAVPSRKLNRKAVMRA